MGSFKEILAWVGQKSGKTFIEYDEKNTTRTCHCCKHILENGIPPNIREWKCQKCQTVHIRDENAAQNGLIQVLRDLKRKCETEVSLVSCSDPIQVTERWVWRVLPNEVLCISRGQNCVNHSAKKLNRRRGSFRPNLLIDHF
ncbi:MAG: transposase [Microcystis sp. M54BS1]|nr:transposase [Microcystis sp. M54BS1]